MSQNEYKYLLSIIICTFNRADLLKKVLEDLTGQCLALASQNIEILVIDNNSTDDTAKVVQCYQAKCVNLVKYFLETNQGLSYARNRGIQESQGELIAFTDDDVMLGKNWLSEVFKIAVGLEPGCLKAFGGTVIAKWEVPKPLWLNLRPPFAITQSVFPSHDYGDETSFYPLNHEGLFIQNPLGANMMFSRQIFEKFGNFRTDLGANAGGGVGLHEDTEFCRYLSSSQVPIQYVPQCIVYHPVPAARMTKQFIRSWYYKSGKSLYWMIHNPRHKKYLPDFFENIKLFGIPVYLLLKVVGLWILWLISHLTFDPKKIFWFSVRFHKALGEIRAASPKFRNFRYQDGIKLTF